jgi:hypothetical protein
MEFKMTVQEKAEKIVNQFRVILMNEDTDCGNEVLCTLIAKKSALLTVDEIMKVEQAVKMAFWKQVKKQIQLL